MRIIGRIRKSLRSLFRREHVEQELDLIVGDLSPRAGRAKSLKQFGAVVQLLQDDQRRTHRIEDFFGDIRYALRLMSKRPGFTTVALLSLALGIGANTAIYSLFYTILLRQLPVSHSEELVQLVRNSPDERHWAGYWSPEEFEYFRDRNHVFSGLTGMSFDNLASVRADRADSETLILENVPENYFQLLGLQATAGRLIGAEDLPARGDGDVVVVSWSYWNRRFHRDPGILGKKIWYNDAPKTVIGVAPQSYVGPRVGSRTDLWQPVKRGEFTMLARLKPGVTLSEAQAEIDVLYRALSEQTGERSQDPRGERRMELLPAGAGLVRVRDQFGKPLVLLMTVVGLLLLLACINLAGMLLARSAGRHREIAVRVGVGASRGRLVRQMLTESMLLSGAGTLIGLLVAYSFVESLVKILASGRAFEQIQVEIQPDLHLLLVAVAIALFTGLLFGWAPALYAFRSAPAAAMRHGGSGGDTRFWRLFGKGLVTAQVALSVFLVTGAAVFSSHLMRLRSFDLGFRSDNVTLMTLDPARSGYRRAQLAEPYRQLLARLESIPGVRSASISGCTPLEGCGAGGRYLMVEGHVEQPEDRQRTNAAFVSPRYFETLGIPLIAGRDFTFGDIGALRVAIVSQKMVRRYFSGVNPIGKHVRIDRDKKSGGWFGSDQPYEIVGVVTDVKAVEIRDAPYPTMYFNMFQENRLADQFELRASGNSALIAETARTVSRQVLPAVPVKKMTTLADQVDSNIVPERLIATLSRAFGALGAVLAGIGLYGLLAHTVARRTREIGIRMALGATTKDINRLVIGDAMGMVVTGLAAGIALVFWGRPLATSLIQDLKWDSPAALAAGGVAILAVALVASYVPALRAGRVDPMVTLRHE